MKTIAISEFKATCIAELKALSASGETLEITLRGKPIARVSPVEKPRRKLGAMRGSVVILGDIVAPCLGDFEDREADLIGGRTSNSKS